MHPIYSLIASLAVLAVGPLVALFGPKNQKPSKILQVLLVLVVLVFIGLEVANHASHINFLSFGIIMVAAMFVAGWIEHTLAKRLKSDQTGGSQTFTMVAVVLGMAIHAVMDGVVLKESYFYLPMAIIVHRIPASLLTWQVLAGRGKPMLAIGLLVLIGIGTLVGYNWAKELLPSHDNFQYVQAIVAGGLLHLAIQHD